MRNTISKLALTAALVLAMAFTLSCSGDDGNEGGSSSNYEGGGGNPGEPVVYEGDIYQTVVIGTQTWFAKNLNFYVEGSECYGEGGEVVEGSDVRTLSDVEIQANCAKYGRLYGWVTAMALPSYCSLKECSYMGEGGEPLIKAKHRGICPSGWHIPNNAEWNTLVEFVGDSAAIKLKAKSEWNDYNGVSGNGTDDYGFAALPGGWHGSYTRFINVGNIGLWWSANEFEVGVYNEYFHAYRWRMYSSGYDSENVVMSHDAKSNMYSVRCVKD
jgi:uncharacterized protein (TIGR02145 family)